MVTGSGTPGALHAVATTSSVHSARSLVLFIASRVQAFHRETQMGEQCSLAHLNPSHHDLLLGKKLLEQIDRAPVAGLSQPEQGLLSYLRILVGSRHSDE